ncbi:MAG: sigma-70 family RNA polymerase sigma factor [Planctomyces sp.]|nr:sigma-70 family RNA polymerase sigma factor [Planctomyces sp.]
MSTRRPPLSNELIQGSQGLVRMLALRLHKRFHERYELDDLIAFGQVGLAQAAKSFDPLQELQFSTYAYYRIRGAIYEGIEKMGWGPRSQFRRRKFLQKASELLEQHSQPSSETPTDDRRWLGGVTQQLVVMSFATLEFSEDAAVDSRPGLDPQDLIAAREVHQRLRQLVARLPDEPRRLIEAMYFEGCSLQEAAGQLQISKGWASRLHSRALSRLGNDLRGMGLADESGVRSAV